MGSPSWKYKIPNPNLGLPLAVGEIFFPWALHQVMQSQRQPIHGPETFSKTKHSIQISQIAVWI